MTITLKDPLNQLTTEDFRDIQELAERVDDIAARFAAAAIDQDDPLTTQKARSRILGALAAMATDATLGCVITVGSTPEGEGAHINATAAFEPFLPADREQCKEETDTIARSAIGGMLALSGEALAKYTNVEFRISAGPIVGTTLARVDWNSTSGEDPMEAIGRAASQAAIGELLGMMKGEGDEADAPTQR